MYYYTQLSYLWKNEIYHQADVLIWRRTGLRCNGKETDKKKRQKKGGVGLFDVFCLRQLFLTLQTTKRHLQIKVQFLFKVYVITKVIKNKEYLEIDGIVPQITKKIDWLLNGASTADFQIIIRLFQLVQSFVSLLNRFCQLLPVCLCFYIQFCFSFYSFAFL